MIFETDGEFLNTSSMISVDPVSPDDHGLYVAQDHSRVFVVQRAGTRVVVKRVRGDSLKTLASKIQHPALLQAAARDALSEE